MPDWCSCGGDEADFDCPACGQQMCELCLEEHAPECEGGGGDDLAPSAWDPDPYELCPKCRTPTPADELERDGVCEGCR